MTRTKKIFTILSALAAAIGISYFLLQTFFNKTRRELNNYIQPMYYDISNHDWDNAVFIKYACHSTKKWLEDKSNNEKLTKTMTYASRQLGRIQSYEGVTGFNIATKDNVKNAIVYTKIIFDKDTKILATQLMQTDGQWCSTGFWILRVKPKK